jgi:hypothetical protein
VDVKTAARYIKAAQAAGLARDGDEAQLSDELLGQVVAAVRRKRIVHRIHQCLPNLSLMIPSVLDGVFCSRVSRRRNCADDQRRSAARADDDPDGSSASAVGWPMFRKVLHVHHSAEDDAP